MKDLNFFRPYLGQNKEKINYQIYVYGMMIIVGLAIAISFGINTTKMMFLDKSISEYNENYRLQIYNRN